MFSRVSSIELKSTSFEIESSSRVSSANFEFRVKFSEFCRTVKKIIVRYKRVGYNINIMRQSACLVFNPVTVNNFASLFNCTPVGRASDSMMAPT